MKTENVMNLIEQFNPYSYSYVRLYITIKIASPFFLGQSTTYSQNARVAIYKEMTRNVHMHCLSLKYCTTEKKITILN